MITATTLDAEREVAFLGKPRTLKVALPQGYDDATQRGELIVLVHKVRGAEWQVEAIIDGYADLTTGTPSSRPGAVLRGWGPNARAASAAADLALYHARHGRTMTACSWDNKTVVVSNLPPFEVALRDQIALYLGLKPWDVELSTEWGVGRDGRGEITAIHITRAGKPELDGVKRRNLWKDIAKALVPYVAGTTWLPIDDAPGEITVRRIGDPLEGMFNLLDFTSLYREENPDPNESWKAFAVARREDGTVVPYSTFHTLVIGQTGAGKGSVLWSIISGMLPAAREGLVEFYAIDPKASEAKDPIARKPSKLFVEVATDAEAWADLLSRMVRDLHKRQESSGRSFTATRTTPLRIIFIDELSALTMMDTDANRKKEAMQNLLIILSQGRSDGFIVIAAAQAPQKEMVGQVRGFFAMRVALRTETPMETDLVLGQGSSEQGAEAHLIPSANPGNSYATAGVGYMRIEGEPLPVRVRFPYTNDQTLHLWSEEFGAIAEAARVPETVELDDLELSLDDLLADDSDGGADSGEIPAWAVAAAEAALADPQEPPSDDDDWSNEGL